MSSHSIHSERGFLYTDRRVERPAAAPLGAVTGFLMEAGEMLHGAIEAPLRRAERGADYLALAGLQDDLRKDLGIDR